MTKLITFLALITCLVAFTPAPAVAATPGSALSIPITGTGTAGTLNATFNLIGFTVQNGQVLAQGVITGTVTNAQGIVTSVVQNVSVPLATGAGASTAACNILHLVIGPINLNLLGLTVTTNQIVIDISAVPGAGNLLGNLLCSVANLLNNPNASLAQLLNQIVGILQGL